MKVALIIAMEEEAAPLVEKLNLPKLEQGLLGLPAVVHQGTTEGGLEVTVVQNGKHGVFGVGFVGTVGAALTTYATIQAFTPDLLINCGTCGGFKSKGGEIGSTYISSAFANHDRRIPIPGFDVYGIGKLDAVAVPKLLEATQWKTGVVSTGNSLDATAEDLSNIAKNDASCKDMEAAAIADVAKAANVPFFALKVVTDIVDGDKPTQEEFMENLGNAASSLQASMSEVLNFLVGKGVADL